jgi:hypothetical protein
MNAEGGDLDAQVGRPWDKVFSEICAHIDRASAVQDHVRDHVAGYVVTHVLLIDGIPCSGTAVQRRRRLDHERPYRIAPRAESRKNHDDRERFSVEVRIIRIKRSGRSGGDRQPLSRREPPVLVWESPLRPVGPLLFRLPVAPLPAAIQGSPAWPSLQTE